MAHDKQDRWAHTMAVPLRHNLTCLWPSEIAEQYYCEYKVHLKKLHPEVQIRLPSLEQGEVSHEELASLAQPMSAAEITATIQAGKKIAIAEWVLEGRFRDVLIRGRPDFIAFNEKKVTLILEFKFTAARRPFQDHEVQAEIYSLLAQGMGFDTGELYFGIIIFPPFIRGPSPSEAALAKSTMLEFFKEDGTLDKIAGQCSQAREAAIQTKQRRAQVEGDPWRAFLYKFSPKKATKDLDWALGYWLSEREPAPVTDYPKKCYSCPLNAANICEHALEGPDRAFIVQRDPGGRVYVSRPRRENRQRTNTETSP